eukprot:scaffold549099_cov18-Prasinocladus_malaysianus.AAC.1
MKRYAMERLPEMICFHMIQMNWHGLRSSRNEMAEMKRKKRKGKETRDEIRGIVRNGVFF